MLPPVLNLLLLRLNMQGVITDNERQRFVVRYHGGEEGDKLVRELRAIEARSKFRVVDSRKP